MITAGAVKVALVLFGIAIVFFLGKSARKSTPDDKHFGTFYNWFTIALILFVLAISDMPYVRIVTKTFSEMIDFVAVSVADKFNKHPPLLVESSSSTATSAAVLPTSRPSDFVEWVSKTQIQPKVGAILPHGWRVSYSDGTNFGVVLAVVDVDAAKTISVYWDPDHAVYPGQKPLPPQVLPGRP